VKQSAASRKINETVRNALAQLLLTEFSDPRLALITVTEVQVSRDRSVAQAFVSSNAEMYEQTLQGLNSAKGRLRSLLGRELGWRVTPELRFVIDAGIDHAQSIDEALKRERRKLETTARATGGASEAEAAESASEAEASDPPDPSAPCASSDPTITAKRKDGEYTGSISAAQVLQLCQSVDNIAIAGHTNPDGDCLGSALALAELLRAQGKQVSVLLGQNAPAPSLYGFLPHYTFVSADHYEGCPQLFIAVDSPTIKRLGASQNVFERAAQTLVIDHHIHYENFANYYFGNAKAAATGNLIWELIKLSERVPTRTMALYCYVAILTDTGRFSFENTNSRAFADACEMVDLGVDPAFVAREVYENKSRELLQLEARLIERTHFLCEDALACSYVTDVDLGELSIARDATEGLPTILRSIQGVKVAALFRQEGDIVRVNLRSRSGIDVGSLAMALGGGGHVAAAGLTLEMPLGAAFAKVMPELTHLLLTCDELTHDDPTPFVQPSGKISAQVSQQVGEIGRDWSSDLSSERWANADKAQRDKSVDKAQGRDSAGAQ
jgi:phosphoesterase RecJ-like protein